MDKLQDLKYWLLDHKALLWSGIIFLLLMTVLPIALYLNQRPTPPPPQAQEFALQCHDIKLYTTTWQPVSLDNVLVGQQIYVAVTGTTNAPLGITKARFSFDNGTTWNEATTRNSNAEFYQEWTVPNTTSVEIQAQVYNPSLGWR